VDIKNNPTYSFTVADTTGTGNRFSLVIDPDPSLAVQLLSFTGIKENQGCKTGLDNENEDNFTQYTLQRSTDGSRVSGSHLVLSVIACVATRVLQTSPSF